MHAYGSDIGQNNHKLKARTIGFSALIGAPDQFKHVKM